MISAWASPFNTEPPASQQTRDVPAKKEGWSNAGLMLAHRLRRWHNITPALGQRPVFAEVQPCNVCITFKELSTTGL